MLKIYSRETVSREKINVLSLHLSVCVYTNEVLKSNYIVVCHIVRFKCNVKITYNNKLEKKKKPRAIAKYIMNGNEELEKIYPTNFVCILFMFRARTLSLTLTLLLHFCSWP